MDFYNEKGLKRFVNAIGFSIAGFKATWRHEEAFRQEGVAVPLAILLSDNKIELVLLIASVTLIMIMELLNSAIETVVDRIGSDYHELAGRAKDIGSAAVMLSIMLAVVTWILILI